MSEKDTVIISNVNIDTHRLARLARLDMSEDEKQAAAAELKKMADYTYPRLVSADSALPFSYCSSVQQPRPDEAVCISDSERKAILASAPTLCDRYITVPRVISEGGEDK